MNSQSLLRCTVALALASLLGACTQKNTADEQAQQESAAATNIALGVDRFLLFPNPVGIDPLAQDGGTFETNTSDYAAAYYRAIDPGNVKDTIDKWRAQNGFTGYANPARSGTEHLAVFRDVKDLGYGRRMTGRRNSDDNSIAFYVENYNVTPGGSASYSSELNVEAAIRRDTQWHVGTNAIEWSTTPCINVANLNSSYDFDPPDCDGTVKFAKYYNFSSKDGTRQLAVDLDGRGLKAMPGPCVTCHGGRGDPLTPNDVSGKPRFPLVENLPSRKRGDVGAHLHGQNVDSFSFSTSQPGFAKSDLQPFLKDFNQWILCTYPSATPATVTGGWGTCTRPTAGANEWQGTAGPTIEYWYGGTGMPNANFAERCDLSGQPCYLPAGWNNNVVVIPSTAVTDILLYRNVVAPYCRTCHILRGTKNQDDINFTTFGTPAAGVTPATGFQSYADRIKVHVFDRGNMPLSLIPHTDFWNSTAPQMLASFIDAQLGPGTATSNGAPLMPGRPIADPGPDRMVRTGSNAVLTGENSLFASTFIWSEPTPSGHVTISNPNGMVAIFNADLAGAYTIRLTVNNGPFKEVKITVDDNFPDPLNIKFAQVKNVLQNVSHGVTAVHCIDCHTPTANVAVATRVPPIWYTDFDRDGSGGLADVTDDAWFLKALQGRVNLTEIGASALLRKPTGNHHNGLKVIDTTDTSTNSNGGLRSFSIFYNWILAGMQPGGVAADPLVSAANTLTFSGSPLYSTGIALDGTKSIGPPTNLLWSVSGPSGPTGAPPVISNPTSPSAVLNVPNVGAYVVRLHVDDGVSSDAVQQTITVSEPTISANFNPQTGTVLPTSPALGRGNITLSSTSTYITPPLPGSPVTCRWQVLSVPAGALALLDGSATLDLTKPCGTDAILNVPTTPAGGQYQVQLTASTLGISVPVSHTLTVSSSAPTANLNNIPTPETLTFANNGTNTTIPTNTISDGSGTAGTAIFPNTSSTLTLDGGASTTPTGTLTYSWCLLSQPDASNFPASVPACPTATAPSSSATTSMTVRATGSYNIQLTVDNGSSPATASKTVSVRPGGGILFTNIVGILNASPCSGCHIYGASVTSVVNPADLAGFPPPWDNATAKDGTTLYQRVRQRVILGSSSSRLLVCPHTGCGAMGGSQTGFVNTTDTNYVNFLTWISNGAPAGN